MAYQPRLDRQLPDLHRLVVHPMADVEDVGEVVDLAAFGRRCRAQPRPGVGGTVDDTAPPSRRRVVAPPHEKPGEIEAVIGMQMRQQHVHGVGVGRGSKGSEHTTTEVEYQRWGVRRGDQISGRGAESGPTTLPEQPSMVIRTLTSLPCPRSAWRKHRSFRSSTSCSRAKVTLNRPDAVQCGPEKLRAARAANASGSPVASNTRRGGGAPGPGCGFNRSFSVRTRNRSFAVSSALDTRLTLSPIASWIRPDSIGQRVQPSMSVSTSARCNGSRYPSARPSTCLPLGHPRSTKSTNRGQATENTSISRAAANAS